MPSLCKERGNRWRGIVKIAGKVVETKLFGQGPAKGEEWMAARQWEMDRRKELLDPSLVDCAPVLTPLDWGVSYLEDAKSRWSAKTFEEKKASMRRFLEYAKDVPLSDYTANFTRTYLQRQNDTRSGYASNRDRKVLMNAWTWGQAFLSERGFPERANPFEAVKRYPEQRAPRRVPSETDFWKAFDMAKGQDRTMLLAVLHLAARKGEVFRLRWSDVDMDGGKVRLVTEKTGGKGQSVTWLPMTRELQSALEAWKRERPYKTEWVFTQLDDTPSPNHRPGEAYISRQHLLKRLCARAGVDKFDFHAIRHLSAVILYRAGYKVSFIQRVLRHKHPMQTETYLQSHGIDLEELRAGMEVFDGRGPAGDVVPAQKKNPQGCNLEGSIYTAGVHTQLN